MEPADLNTQPKRAYAVHAGHAPSAVSAEPSVVVVAAADSIVSAEVEPASTSSAAAVSAVAAVGVAPREEAAAAALAGSMVDAPRKSRQLGPSYRLLASGAVAASTPGDGGVWRLLGAAVGCFALGVAARGPRGAAFVALRLGRSGEGRRGEVVFVLAVVSNRLSPSSVCSSCSLLMDRSRLWSSSCTNSSTSRRTADVSNESVSPIILDPPSGCEL